MNIKDKRNRKIRRQKRIRGQIKGTAECPRLCVVKTLKHVYLQAIDDNKGVTVAKVSDLDLKEKKWKNRVELGTKLGEEIAKQVLAKKISKVVFDRRGSKYTGIVKAVAEGARKGGLKF